MPLVFFFEEGFPTRARRRSAVTWTAKCVNVKHLSVICIIKANKEKNLKGNPQCRPPTLSHLSLRRHFLPAGARFYSIQEFFFTHKSWTKAFVNKLLSVHAVQVDPDAKNNTRPLKSFSFQAASAKPGWSPPPLQDVFHPRWTRTPSNSFLMTAMQTKRGNELYKHS